MVSLLFYGRSTISLNLSTPSRIVVLHSVDLNLSNIQLRMSDRPFSDVVKPSANRTDMEKEYIVLKFSRPLRSGNWSISLDFNGQLTDSLRGT